MLHKFSPVAALFMLMLFMVLTACRQNQGGGTRDTTFSIDTSVAAASLIPISEAVTLQQGFISTYSELQKLIRDTGFLAKNFNIPHGEAFSKDAILLLLSQKDAVAVRIYYGKDAKGAVRLILLPIRKDGSVIYNRLITARPPGTDSLPRAQATAAEAQAVETGQTCPPCMIDPQVD